MISKAKRLIKDLMSTSSGPDFVGVGYPKCGTTFVYKTLTSHPQVENSKKERHYFSKPFYEFDESDYKEYRSLFKSYGDNLVGEFSPGALYYPTNIQFLSQAAPDAKYVVLLRNPIDRFFSHMRQMENYRLEEVSPDNVERFYDFSLYPEAAYSGLYEVGIRNAIRYCGIESIIILQYEKLLSDFETEFKKLCRFLNIEEYIPDVEIREPTRYEQYDYMRPHLKNFYTRTVSQINEKYSTINKYSEINTSIWGDFERT